MANLGRPVGHFYCAGCGSYHTVNNLSDDSRELVADETGRVDTDLVSEHADELECRWCADAVADAEAEVWEVETPHTSGNLHYGLVDGMWVDPGMAVFHALNY